jgi:hypothetical protein
VQTKTPAQRQQPHASSCSTPCEWQWLILQNAVSDHERGVEDSDGRRTTTNKDRDTADGRRPSSEHKRRRERERESPRQHTHQTNAPPMSRRKRSGPIVPLSLRPSLEYNRSAREGRFCQSGSMPMISPVWREERQASQQGWRWNSPYTSHVHGTSRLRAGKGAAPHTGTTHKRRHHSEPARGGGERQATHQPLRL